MKLLGNQEMGTVIFTAMSLMKMQTRKKKKNPPLPPWKNALVLLLNLGFCPTYNAMAACSEVCPDGWLGPQTQGHPVFKVPLILTIDLARSRPPRRQASGMSGYLD